MKVVVVASVAMSLTHFRGELLRTMRDRGHEVVAVAPDEREEAIAWLADIGVRFASVPMARTGVDPVQDLGTLRALYRLMRAEKPDLVLAYTPKPVIHGLIAARLARVPTRVALISGRPSALGSATGLKQKLFARMIGLFMAIALRGAQLVFFQNPDDEQLFRSLGLVGRGQRRVRVNGSGVDLDRYAAAPLPDGPTTFLMLGRLLRTKGVVEYVEAARLVKVVRPEARFRLVGGADSNHFSLTEDELERMRAEGTVEHNPWVQDVRPLIADAHVVVLPSYHEGTPRSVLEGMSMGRAIISTDVPGCRETVEPGRNGILVPARDARRLAEAMRDLVEHPELVAEMGAQSRQIAEERFDVREVNRIMIDAMGL
jgi:glycosyltransferase involved in cell wall biosynthesis